MGKVDTPQVVVGEEEPSVNVSDVLSRLSDPMINSCGYPSEDDKDVEHALEIMKESIEQIGGTTFKFYNNKTEHWYKVKKDEVKELGEILRTEGLTGGGYVYPEWAEGRGDVTQCINGGVYHCDTCS